MKREPKLDLFGEPIKPRPKCKHCGKVDWDHRSKTRECPAGAKHRTVGYTSFGPTTFEAHDK